MTANAASPIEAGTVKLLSRDGADITRTFRKIAGEPVFLLMLP
jgi:hypothetical protein